MPVAGLDLAQVQAYQDYVEEFAPELLAIALSGFKTAGYLTGEQMPLGKKTWSVLNSTERVLKVFSTTYEGSELGEIIPRTLETHLTKGEVNIIPSNLRKSYLGMFTLPNNEVIPEFLEMMLSYFLMRLMTDFDELIWKGDTSLTGVLGTFDGFDKQIATAIDDLVLTPNATGLITKSNIIESFEGTYDLLSDEIKDSGMPLHLYCSQLNKDIYAREYKNSVLKYTDAGVVQTMLFGTNVEIVAVPKWRGTSKVAVTAKDNMNYGYNEKNGQITSIKQHYHLENSTTPEIGALIMKPWDGELAVNDQF